jgi:hypothetical protein
VLNQWRGTPPCGTAIRAAGRSRRNPSRLPILPGLLSRRRLTWIPRSGGEKKCREGRGGGCPVEDVRRARPARPSSSFLPALAPGADGNGRDH